MAPCPRDFATVCPCWGTLVFPPVCPPVRPKGFTPVYSFFGPTGLVCPEASYVGKGALMPVRRYGSCEEMMPLPPHTYVRGY